MSQSTSDCAKPLHTHLTLEDIRKMMDEETEAMKSEDEDIDEDIDEEGDAGEGLSVKEQARKQRKEDDTIPGRAPRSMETLQVMRRDDILQVGDRKDTRRDVYLCACEQDEVDGKKNRVRRTGDNIFDLVCVCNKSNTIKGEGENTCKRRVYSSREYDREKKQYGPWVVKECSEHTCQSASWPEKANKTNYTYVQLAPIVIECIQADPKVSGKSLKHTLSKYTHKRVSSNLVGRVRDAAFKIKFGTVKSNLADFKPWVNCLEEQGHLVKYETTTKSGYEYILIHNERGMKEPLCLSLACVCFFPCLHVTQAHRPHQALMFVDE